jgi:hypothetical protein
MTQMDIISALPVDGQKCAEIALGDAHHAVEPVRCKRTGGHPPANRSVGDIQRRCDIPDREKPRCSNDPSTRLLRVVVLSHLTNLLLYAARKSRHPGRATRFATAI